jgi:hypothetical protein
MIIYDLLLEALAPEEHLRALWEGQRKRWYLDRPVWQASFVADWWIELYLIAEKRLRAAHPLGLPQQAGVRVRLHGGGTCWEGWVKGHRRPSGRNPHRPEYVVAESRGNRGWRPTPAQNRSVLAPRLITPQKPTL